MDLDLTPLERAAERAGLPGLRARLVPPDRRRGGWFDWVDGTLLVSESIVDRCSPEEGVALLTVEILARRGQARLRRSLTTGLVLLVALLIALAAWRGPDALLVVLALVGAVALMAWWAVGSGRALLDADDAAVGLLGGATTLVRALNRMDQEQLRLGASRRSARPDLHRRAERLATLHRLREKASHA